MCSIDASSLGVVLSGGGTRSGYQVGALRALAEVHGIKDPKVVVAMSGGAGPGVFYLAGRFDEMYEWAWRFDDPRFISWLRMPQGPIMDTDFLVDCIFAQQVPSLEKEVRKSPTNYFLASMRFPDQALHWFSRDSGEPLFEQLRATKTMPGISQLGVGISGNLFGDGCLAASVEDCVLKASSEGAKRIILIDNSTYGRASLFTRGLIRYGTRNAHMSIRVAAAAFCERRSTPINEARHLHVCRAHNLPAAHGLVRSADLLKASIEQGYSDMAQMQFA